MNEVNFRTDTIMYNKFKIICIIKNEKIREKLTEFIQKYVSENENLIENPEIQKIIPAEIPTLFDKHEK